MRYKNLIFFISLFFYLNAQEDLSYQSPHDKILELIDVTLPPRVLIDEKKEHMVYLYRDNYKTIEQLSEKELRLAGLRINPKKNIGSRISYYSNLKISLISDEDSNIIENFSDLEDLNFLIRNILKISNEESLEIIGQSIPEKNPILYTETSFKIL